MIGVLVNPNDPITTNSETNDMRAAARSVGQRIEILQASTAHDIETAFASLIGMQVGALLVALRSDRDGEHVDGGSAQSDHRARGPPPVACGLCLPLLCQ